MIPLLVPAALGLLGGYLNRCCCDKKKYQLGGDVYEFVLEDIMTVDKIVMDAVKSDNIIIDEVVNNKKTRNEIIFDYVKIVRVNIKEQTWYEIRFEIKLNSNKWEGTDEIFEAELYQTSENIDSNLYNINLIDKLSTDAESKLESYKEHIYDIYINNDY
jgi:hypothetical protein